MQTCENCGKEIYGHPIVKGIVICGSCTLSNLPQDENAEKPKSMFQVRLNMAKTLRNAPLQGEPEMTVHELTVQGVSNKVILLDGKYALVFNEVGIARCPTHLRVALEREMAIRPGRYTIVEEVARVVPAKTDFVKQPVPVEKKDPEVEGSKQLDLSYLTDNSVKADKPAKKKK